MAEISSSAHLFSHNYRQGLSFQATKYSSRLSLSLGRLYSVVQNSPKLLMIGFPSKISHKVQPPSCMFWELNSRHSKHLEPAPQEVPLRLVNFYYYVAKWLLTSFSFSEESWSQPHSLSRRSESSPLCCAHTLAPEYEFFPLRIPHPRSYAEGLEISPKPRQRSAIKISEFHLIWEVFNGREAEWRRKVRGLTALCCRWQPPEDGKEGQSRMCRLGWEIARVV